MEPQKSFWKKYEWAIIAIITLLVIYSIVVSSQKINFFLGNELIVYLSPLQKSFSVHYNELSKAQFDVSIENSAYCKATCSYSFNDRSSNSVVDEGDFEIRKGQHFTKEYELSVKRLGSGQDIYSFDVSCSSIRSALCFTKGIETSRSSFITVDYDLTETEKELKKELKRNVTILLLLLADADVHQQKLSQKYFELGFRINLNNLSKGKIKIDDDYNKFAVSAENLRSLWSTEDYNRLNQLFNQSFFENLAEIGGAMKKLDMEIDNIVELHNELLPKLLNLGKNFKALESFAIILENETLVDSGISNFNAVSSNLTNNTFENYGEISKSIEDLRNRQASIMQDTRLASSKFFFNAGYFLKFDSDLLCSLVQKCKENISISNAVKKTEEFLQDYPDELSLKGACNELNELNNKYISARNETLGIIENNSINFSSDAGFLELAEIFKDNEIIRINNSYLESFEKLKNQTIPEIAAIAEQTLPKNKAQAEQLEYNQSLNLPLYSLSKLKPSEETMGLLGKCKMLDSSISGIGIFDFGHVNTVINHTAISRISTSLSDNFPVCCIFGECKPCCNDDSCRNDPRTFPIIFLHGHALAKSNSPEFSLDAFNRLQSRLQDDGYLNAGIVSLYSQNEPGQKGIWGLSGKPITVKASYYFDAFKKEDKYIVVPTKSESIDTYALRLREIIELVKERTHKPKVNIIAHSMGGLVARRYIQIFGDENVDKLVLVAVPNMGISGAVSDYCGFLGENRECQDMQENSLFMNKLNDPAKQPSKVKAYAIVGQGCEMKLGDGDGVVLSRNSKLENAKTYFVNGTCGGLFGENLHTEILNIEKYNETYGVIRSILKE
ncbi:alpha/beta fold hydrolase [Candidatus Woesearchaeota archaeon]|nr:alpha/beta fold hydrolase [Candidatus Woesearchaeota archaeon]